MIFWNSGVNSRTRLNVLIAAMNEVTQVATELADGKTGTLKAGQSYQVADNTLGHRSSTASGAKLFIVD